MDKLFAEKIKCYEYRPRQAVSGIIFNETKELLSKVSALIEEILYHQNQAWAVKQALRCYLNEKDG